MPDCTLHLTGDAYQGSPVAVISLDGEEIKTVTITALHGAPPQAVVVTVSDAGGKLTVHMQEDAWGGSADLDRNLYVVTGADEVKLSTARDVYSLDVPAHVALAPAPAPADLSRPNLIAAAETLAMPSDWSDMAGQVNGAIEWCRNHKRTKLTFGEGCSEISAPISVTSDVHLAGTGIPGPNAQDWDGGTVLRAPLNSRRAVLSVRGENRGQDSSGMKFRVHLERMGVYGAMQAWHATDPEPQEALIDIRNVAYLSLDRFWFGQDYRPALRLDNVWDSELYGNTITNSPGFSDPTVTADRDDVTAYLGRKFLPVETAIKRSIGIPAMEVISPATTGGDVANNIDNYSMRIESNASNGPAAIFRGKNGSKFRNYGCKFEAMEGCAPVLVVCDAGDFAFDGELMGGGTGAPFGDVGGVKSGTPWSQFVQPAIALFHNCYSPRLVGEIAHSGGGGKVEALIRAIDTFDPRFSMRVSDGLSQVLQARMLFEGCTDVSLAANDCYAYPYLLAVAGANQAECKLVNSTTR